MHPFPCTPSPSTPEDPAGFAAWQEEGSTGSCLTLQVGLGSQLRVLAGSRCQPDATSGAWGRQVTARSQGPQCFPVNSNERPHAQGVFKFLFPSFIFTIPIPTGEFKWLGGERTCCQQIVPPRAWGGEGFYWLKLIGRISCLKADQIPLQMQSGTGSMNPASNSLLCQGFPTSDVGRMSILACPSGSWPSRG